MKAIGTGTVASGELHLSSRYYTMLGYVPGELRLGWDSWMAMAHPDDAKVVDAEFARFGQFDHNTFSMEIRMRCKSGQDHLGAQPREGRRAGCRAESR